MATDSLWNIKAVLHTHHQLQRLAGDQIYIENQVMMMMMIKWRLM